MATFPLGGVRPAGTNGQRHVLLGAASAQKQTAILPPWVGWLPLSRVLKFLVLVPNLRADSLAARS